MDSRIVVAAVAAAVSTSAVEGLDDAAKQVVADAYASLKVVLARKYTSVDISMVEAKPDSISRRNVLEAELVEAGADGDGELRAAAEHMLRIVDEYAPQAPEWLGVKLARVTADELEISKIRARGALGVSANDVHVGGRFAISDVTAEQQLPHPQ